MGVGPLGTMLMVGFTLFALVLVFGEVRTLFGKLAWLALLGAGIGLAPAGAQVVAPVATILILGAKGSLDRARGSAM